jgi:NAD(P)-dependent dehydrogenase (short-subunit alcohol dehydrogenase family)
MKVVVIGASGTIGKAVTTLLTEQGHEIVRVSRNTQPSVNIDDPASIDTFYKTLGEVDAIINVAGRLVVGYSPLAEVSDEEFQFGIRDRLMGQVNLVRKGLSNVRPGGVFILTGGTFAFDPWPKTSVMTMDAAGIEGFVRSAALDLQDVRLVVVHPPICRETAIQLGMDGAPWPSAATVAETYRMALESQITGQPVYVEGYRPS